LSARIFEEKIRLLEDIVAGFVTRYASLLEQLEAVTPPGSEDLQHVLPTLGINSCSNAAPAVLQAIRHVEQRLADPDLTVGSVACALGLHTTYLGNVFSRQTGMHLRRYIALRRFHHAAHLLTTTTLSIKQIAYQVGYVIGSEVSATFSVYDAGGLYTASDPFTLDFAVVPEPASLGMLLIGGLFAARRRR